MKKYDHIIIGFGKGGKTLANELALSGQSTAIIEESSKMFGGTCINIACIPSKIFEYSARLSNLEDRDFSQKSAYYKKTV